MKQGILKPLYHRGLESIGIYFENNSVLNTSMKKVPGIKWSQTNKCWYLPLSRDSFDSLCRVFDAGEAKIESRELKKYLENKKMATPLKSSDQANLPVKIAAPGKTIYKSVIASVKENVLPLMEQRLKLKAFSSSTIRTYLNRWPNCLQP